MMVSKEEREELRELVASVTLPLPWKSDSDGVIVSDLYDSVAECDDTGADFIDPRPAKLIANSINALPKLLNALDAADERTAGLEADAKHWRESALAWARWAASVTGESGQEIPDLTKFVESLKARIAELEKRDARRLELIVQREEWTNETEAALKARIAELEAAAQWRPMASITGPEG